jgi:hypothetical protein
MEILPQLPILDLRIGQPGRKGVRLEELRLLGPGIGELQVYEAAAVAAPF